MRARVGLILGVALAVAAGALAVRAGIGSGGAQADQASLEQPIVAPSRVVVSEGEARVRLDSAEMRHLGLTTAPLSAASVAAGRQLAGQVIPEPERTVTLRAPVSGRLRVAEGSQWPSLGARVARGTALGRVSDAQPLIAPLSGVVTRIGARPGEIVEAGQTLLEISDLTRPVVRIVWPEDAGRPRDHLTLLPPGEGRPIVATLIGAAPEADPLTRQPAYLYRARTRWLGAVPGTPVSATIAEGGQVRGALVPDRAVVQWEGLSWAYIQRSPGEFVRIRVPTDRPVAGGWIAGAPIAVGDTVVVVGAQELLSEEFRARVTVGDESGE